MPCAKPPMPNYTQNSVDKFTKLKKESFSIECFTVDFLQTSCTIVKIHLLHGQLGTHHQFQAFQGFPGNVLNF